MTEQEAVRIIFRAERAKRSIRWQLGFDLAGKEDSPCLDYFTASAMFGSEFALGYCEYWGLPTLAKIMEQ